MAAILITGGTGGSSRAWLCRRREGDAFGGQAFSLTINLIDSGYLGQHLVQHYADSGCLVSEGSGPAALAVRLGVSRPHDMYHELKTAIRGSELVPTPFLSPPPAGGIHALVEPRSPTLRQGQGVQGEDGSDRRAALPCSGARPLAAAAAASPAAQLLLFHCRSTLQQGRAWTSACAT
jgi:hypothetical protein